MLAGKLQKAGKIQKYRDFAYHEYCAVVTALVFLYMEEREHDFESSSYELQYQKY